MNSIIVTLNEKIRNEKFIALDLDLSLSGCYGGKCYRKPMTVRGYESMSPEF